MSFHFVGDGPVKSTKTPNQNDVERYNMQKNAQLIAEEYLDIDA